MGKKEKEGIHTDERRTQEEEKETEGKEEN